jgi:hypothetical protein
MTNTQTILILAVLAVATLLAAWWIVVTRRKQLKEQFGPEYDRVVREAGTPLRAESELLARERRVSRYKVRPLTPDEHRDFTERWRRVQARFVDDPSGALAASDRLVTELMEARGYPTSDFNRRTEDLTVDHASVIDHYRDAHTIAERHARQPVATEELRQALIHYRALFDDLLEVQPEKHRERIQA